MSTFDGATYEPLHDRARLRKQLGRVKEFMADGRWRTLAEISEVTGAPQASVSARLRDLRKAKFGARVVDRRRKGPAEHGLHEYRVVPVELEGFV